MTVLPRQVQAQLDEATQLEASLAAPPPPAPTEPAPAPAAVVPPPEPQPAPRVEPEQTVEYWKQRFDTIQGKYNAEVPRLTQGLEEMRRALEEIRNRPAPASTPVPQLPTALVTEKDEQTFGADLVDMARRVAREEGRAVEQELARVRTAIQSITPATERVRKIEEDVAATRQQSFYRELHAAVPDWEAINTDQKWLAWLAEYDPVAGKTRQDALNEAANSLNYQRVIALFRAFKGPQPSSQEQSRADLARQVAPSRSSTTTSVPPGQKQFSEKDYVYWTDPRRVHDTPKEKLQSALAEIETALMEGRVKF